MTPLWTNNVTPFLRWSSGDLVTWQRGDDDSGPFSVFPLIKHAHRTSGFFKIRGININHADFEDFIFRNVEISDFKAELVTERDLDTMLLSVEVRRGVDAAAAVERAEVRGAEPVRADAADRRGRDRQPRQGIRSEREDAAFFRPAAVKPKSASKDMLAMPQDPISLPAVPARSRAAFRSAFRIAIRRASSTSRTTSTCSTG